MPIPLAVAKNCIAQPLVMIRSADPAIERLTVPSWRSAKPTLCGWHLATLLPGSGHNDFTDLTVFAPEIGLDRARRAAWSLGSIAAATAIEAERAYVLNFFERWIQ
jgi:hypothetical protein